jgi:hypothetical protein
MATTVESRQRSATSSTALPNGTRVVRLYGGSVDHTAFTSQPAPKPTLGTVMLYGQQVPHKFVVKA